MIGGGVPIGVAYPWRSRDREKLREAHPKHAIPAIPPGSHEGKCVRCQLPIVIGPRLAVSGLILVCAGCAYEAGMTGFWLHGRPNAVT